MKRLFLVLTLFFAIGISELLAQWSNNSAQNTPIAVGKFERYDINVIADGAGNTYTTWYDYNTTHDSSGVYAQKISPTGTVLWAVGGAKAYWGTNTVEATGIGLDGVGGVFVTWRDSRSTDTSVNIYGQHVSSAGAIQWTQNGINLTQIPALSFRSPLNPQILSNGNGSFYFSWDDAFGVELVKVTASGGVTWSVVADSSGWAAFTMCIVTDGAGGIILAWTDNRNSLAGDGADIYAQRVDASGNVSWGPGGVVVSAATNLQESPQIVADGSGGAIVAWEDFRGGSQQKGYTQKLNSSGAAQWTANGVALCSSTESQNDVYIASDGAGGAIFCWEESRPSSNNIYSQRINSAGQLQWGATGMAVSTNKSPHADPRIAADGNGGATIVWDDNRNTGINIDIYAQRMNASGQAQWTADGIAISSAANNQERPFVVSQPNQAAVLVWSDYRANGGNTYTELYAQYVSKGGALSGVRENATSVPHEYQLQQNFPNPFNPSTEIQFQLPDRAQVRLVVYNTLGQQVKELVNNELNAGSFTATWDGKNDSGEYATSGVYLYRLVAANYSVTKKMVLMK